MNSSVSQLPGLSPATDVPSPSALRASRPPPASEPGVVGDPHGAPRPERVELSACVRQRPFRLLELARRILAAGAGFREALAGVLELGRSLRDDL